MHWKNGRSTGKGSHRLSPNRTLDLSARQTHAGAGKSQSTHLLQGAESLKCRGRWLRDGENPSPLSPPTAWEKPPAAHPLTPSTADHTIRGGGKACTRPAYGVARFHGLPAAAAAAATVILPALLSNPRVFGALRCRAAAVALQRVHTRLLYVATPKVRSNYYFFKPVPVRQQPKRGFPFQARSKN